MKKMYVFLSATISALALILSVQTAQADVQVPVWTCGLTFDVEGGGLRLIVGSFKLEGQGQISCVDAFGHTEAVPVYVTMGGAPISLGAGLGKLRLIGAATGIGVAGQPSDLLGNYMVAGIRGSLGIGAGADLALHATHRAITLNVAVQAVSGLGANVGLDFLRIEAL